MACPDHLRKAWQSSHKLLTSVRMTICRVCLLIKAPLLRFQAAACSNAPAPVAAHFTSFLDEDPRPGLFQFRPRPDKYRSYVSAHSTAALRTCTSVPEYRQAEESDQ